MLYELLNLVCELFDKRVLLIGVAVDDLFMLLQCGGALMFFLKKNIVAWTLFSYSLEGVRRSPALEGLNDLCVQSKPAICL